MPFVLQTVKSISADDGRGTVSTINYTYEGGLYNFAEREFLGFRKVTASTSETTVQNLFYQDLLKKGKVEQTITNSYDGHQIQINNIYEVRPLDGGASFPALISTTTTVTDAGAEPFTITKTFDYDSYLNLRSTTTSGTQSETVISESEFTDYAPKWIVAKPTISTVKNAAGEVMSRKWMDYDPVTGNLLSEETCRSDDPRTGCLSRNIIQNPVVTYSYFPEGNLNQVTEPLNRITTYTYDAATKTHVYEKTNALGHKTTTVYENGKLIIMVPPHLDGSTYNFTYTYDSLGRRDTEYRPDGGWTKYTYVNLGAPSTQYTMKQEHIVGGSETYPDLIGKSYFDGLGRTYKVEASGPENKTIVIHTIYDNFGRVVQKSNPYFEGETIYYSTMTYDGLSRLTTATAPDSSSVSTYYQGLTKIVVDQNNHQTTNRYDIYQRLRSVTDARGTVTGYDYDTPGNLIQVTAAMGLPEQNIITINYDSLGQKRSMTDPDMGCWTYAYDMLGNLTTQVDAKGQQITFTYDAIGRVTEKRAGTTILASYVYDSPSMAYSKGKLIRVTDGKSLDVIISLDVMQRPLQIRMHYDSSSSRGRTVSKTYDSTGRIASITYDMGTSRTYTYHYNAGALAALKDPQGQAIVSYNNFTALGQPQTTIFPKASGASVQTLKTYRSDNGRLIELWTKKIAGTDEITYQRLTYDFDPKGNLLTLNDIGKNDIQHFQYDELDRLIQASAEGNSAYTQQFSYDAIGNILNKSDVGAYSYNYADKPHSVRAAGDITLQYDANGNMITRNKTGGPNITVEYTPDNRPSRIIKITGDSNLTIAFTYDGNGIRIKKHNETTGAITYYWGEFYERQGSSNKYHLFGNERVATIDSSGNGIFYHSDHLGSTSVVTDDMGNKCHEIGYYPFGTYRYGGSSSAVKYTFTGQEDDNEIGLYNFRARLYDPELGRFISADTIVPEPGNLQSLNRYSYCYNNPLIYIDPSGHWGWEAVFAAVIIGAIIGGATAAAAGNNIFVGAFTGALTGGLTVVGGVAGAAAGGALSGVINAHANGGDPALGGILGGMAGIAGACAGSIIAGANIANPYVNAGITVAAGGVVGGTLSAMAGGNFWEGSAYGAAGAAATLAMGIYDKGPTDVERIYTDIVRCADNGEALVTDQQSIAWKINVNWGKLGTGTLTTGLGVGLGTKGAAEVLFGMTAILACPWNPEGYHFFIYGGMNIGVGSALMYTGGSIMYNSVQIYYCPIQNVNPTSYDPISNMAQ